MTSPVARAPSTARLNHIALMVPSIEDALAWYLSNLDFAVVDRWADASNGMEWAHLRLGDFLLELVHMPGRNPPAPHSNGFHHFAVTVDDCERFVAELEDRGVSVAVPPSYFQRHHMDWAFIQDCLGNIIEVVSYRDATGRQSEPFDNNNQRSGDQL